MFCATCGAQATENAKFCAGCGSAFGQPVNLPQQIAQGVYMERKARKDARSAALAIFVLIVIAEVWFMSYAGIDPSGEIGWLFALIPFVVAGSIYYASISASLTKR